MKQDTLTQLMSSFPDCSVAVLGDFMLDRYIWGRASRISQEAPVPIVRVDHESVAPGGAANVVRNIHSLGGHAVAFGVTGTDVHGDRLCSLLASTGADTSGIVRCSTRETTVKTRILAASQQVVRVDREDTTPIESRLIAQVRERLLTTIGEGSVQAIILEDYAKGLLSKDLVCEVVSAANRNGIIVALDPHPSHPFGVPGLHLLTPNRAEVFALAGVYYQPGQLPLEQDDALLAAGEKILADWQVDMLLVTLGGNGMALFRGGMSPLHIPTRAREVFDVSGAGDTVTASFVMTLLAGGSPAEAAELANCAAGIVVGKVGTASVTGQELADHLTEVL